ncbi:polysaccharide biosynthesis/export family protein [Hymenobacter sp. B81]|uniref:polysaccharide biosynthesis/export family protein n=1 Tax=Hymenobacter sp. B81 TaxID=3344878 RepID=UPI0037DDD249
MLTTSLPRALRLLLLAFPLALLVSCASSRAYRQNILFRTDATAQPDSVRLRGAMRAAENKYRIRPHDYLEVRVYTNQGERLIDPNGELGFGAPGGASTGAAGTGSTPSRITPSTRAGGGAARASIGAAQGGGASLSTDYLVQPDGSVMLPVVYRVPVAGLTVPQLDSLLQVRYEEFYRGVFVQSRVTNNRIIVLGTPGGAIIPMNNENMNLLEVLAAVGGIDGNGMMGNGQPRYGRAYNIRLIRPGADGDLRKAQVQIIDLTTIEGMRSASLRVQPNDVVYIEPLRRPVLEAVQDIGPVLTIFTSLTSFVTTLFLIRRL